MKMNTNRMPAPTPTPTSLPVHAEHLRGEAAPGYLTSSFELRAGLEVSALALSQLPAEVLGELMRLRDSWSSPHLALAA